jgi:hypothetical protein
MRLFAIIAVAIAAHAATPTFNKDIAPILYQNCATCHRPGEVAPFSLLTYADAAKKAGLLAIVTEKRIMPPWKAEPGYGSFANERRLSEPQIALIREWDKAGAPEGDAKGKPTPPAFPNGWEAGQPDKVLTLSHKFEVAADGPDQYRCFVLPLDTAQDVYLSGMEFRPGNRRVVHHALVFADATGAARKLAADSPDGGYACFGGPKFRPWLCSAVGRRALPRRPIRPAWRNSSGKAPTSSCRSTITHPASPRRISPRLG